MRQWLRVSGFTALSVLLLAGCAATPKTEDTGTHHTLRSTELRMLMRDIDGVMLEQRQEFSELERETRKRRYALRLSDAIERMSSKVLTLRTTAFSTELNEEESARFEGFATQLRSEGRAIGEMARTYRLEQLDNAISRVKDTCTACHNTFRDGQKGLK